MNKSIYMSPDIEQLREMHKDMLALDHGSCTIAELLEMQARTILEAHGQGNAAVKFHLGSWCPDFAGFDTQQVMDADLSLDQVLLTVSREHGFDSWDEVGKLQDLRVDPEFETTVDVLLQGEMDSLAAMLASNPTLATQRSNYGHNATLLHYIGANGVESHRQYTPFNAVEVARCVIDAGADVNAIANIYGGSKTLGLIVTSAHPHNAGVVEQLAGLLESAGAT